MVLGVKKCCLAILFLLLSFRLLAFVCSAVVGHIIEIGTERIVRNNHHIKLVTFDLWDK
jgi:hypothetical protein